MLSSLRASLSRLSLTTPVTKPGMAAGHKLPALATFSETTAPLSTVMSRREYRVRPPSSTDINGYYLPPPSKHNVWSKKYTLHDYCRLVHPLTGERRGMDAAFWRFKRLDWGQYIRAKAGRYRKLWKRCAPRLWQREAHVFCKSFHNRRFERMFHPEWKEKRHIPDDIYEKYNKTSYFKHRATKMKNLKRIEELGNTVHKFDRYKSHLVKHFTKYNYLDKYYYEPPEYMRSIHDNDGVFDPGFVPADTPAPHFSRPPIRGNKHMRDKGWNYIKKRSGYFGDLDPWLPIMKGRYTKY